MTSMTVIYIKQLSQKETTASSVTVTGKVAMPPLFTLTGAMLSVLTDKEVTPTSLGTGS